MSDPATPSTLSTAPSTPTYPTCMVLMLGYPGMGKRTIGERLAMAIDGVLVDNALISRPLLELWRWDGIEPLPAEVWDRAAEIRAVVLDTIETMAPASTSYVFTNVIKDEPQGAEEYDQLRALARRRGSLFLAVMLSCDIEAQVSRIANPDRVARRKGADPEGYRWHRLSTVLFQPPADEVLHLDSSVTPPEVNSELIAQVLRERGYSPDPPN